MSKKHRVPRRFFDPYENTNENTRRIYEANKTLTFEKGYILKKFSVKSIEHEGINPTLEEIKFFLSKDDDEREKVLSALSSITKRKTEFQRNDNVLVVKG